MIMSCNLSKSERFWKTGLYSFWFSFFHCFELKTIPVDGKESARWPQHGAWEIFVLINERIKDVTEGRTKHWRVKVSTGLNSLKKRGRRCNRKLYPLWANTQLMFSKICSFCSGGREEFQWNGEVSVMVRMKAIIPTCTLVWSLILQSWDLAITCEMSGVSGIHHGWTHVPADTVVLLVASVSQ